MTDETAEGYVCRPINDTKHTSAGIIALLGRKSRVICVGWLRDGRLIGKPRWRPRSRSGVGRTDRGAPRWRLEPIKEHDGFDGLFDHRRQRPSPRCAPLAEAHRLLALYRERHAGCNVRHFHEIAHREHGVTLSYSFVKKALQAAGLVAKRRPRGRQHTPGRCRGWRCSMVDSLHRPRSEERRVGKEGRCRWAPEHYKDKD